VCACSSEASRLLRWKRSSISAACGTSTTESPPAAFYSDVSSALQEIEGDAARV
jgi:hypothetical protein